MGAPGVIIIAATVGGNILAIKERVISRGTGSEYSGRGNPEVERWGML